MSTGVQASKGEREALIIARDFDRHEQQLFLRHRGGKSLHALAQLYRQYEGENGVQEKLNELTARMGSATSEQTSTGPAAAAAERLARDEEDDASGGMPIRSVAAGSLNGGGAGGHVLPPTRPAPRPSVPSGPVLDAPRRSPARTRSVAPGERTAPEREAAERDETVRRLLEAEPCSAAHIAEKLGCSRGLVRKSLERLDRRGIAEGTGEATYDFTRSGAGGPPATAWRIIGDRRKVRFPADAHHPATSASRAVNAERRERVLAALMARPRSQRALCLDLEMRAPLMRTALTALLVEGKARSTGDSVHDWPGARKGVGRPSCVWEAVDGPRYVPPVAADIASGAGPHVDDAADWAAALKRHLVSLDRPALEAELAEGRQRVAALEGLLGAMDALAGSFA